MKGIEKRKRKDGKASYRAHYTSNKILYRKTFRRESDAIEWLEKQRQIHPYRPIKENERFADISFSGLKNRNNQNLYICFDKEANAYRLATSEQIKNRRGIRFRGSIEKTKYGTYSLYITQNKHQYNIQTFKTKKEAVEKQKQVLHQIVLGKPIKIPTRNSTGYKYISKRNDGKEKEYRFRLDKKRYKICRYFYTLQEALDFREKYFKENGLEMPKDYIELNFN